MTAPRAFGLILFAGALQVGLPVLRTAFPPEWEASERSNHSSARSNREVQAPIPPSAARAAVLPVVQCLLAAVTAVFAVVLCVDYTKATLSFAFSSVAIGVVAGAMVQVVVWAANLRSAHPVTEPGIPLLGQWWSGGPVPLHSCVLAIVVAVQVARRVDRHRGAALILSGVLVVLVASRFWRHLH